MQRPFSDRACVRYIALFAFLTTEAVMSVRLFALAALCGIPLSIAVADQPPAQIPSSHEVTDLLRREPVAAESWPAWRERLLA